MIRMLQDEIPPQQDMRLAGVDGFLPYNAIASLIFSSMGPPPNLEEAAGLRNRYVDRFLPTKRQKAPNSAANGNGAGPPAAATALPTSLQFLHRPIMDLSVPSTELCAILPEMCFQVCVILIWQSHHDLVLAIICPAQSNTWTEVYMFLNVDEADDCLLTGCRLDKLLPDLNARLVAGEPMYLHCWGGRGRAGVVAACLLRYAYGLSAEEALERVGRAFSTRGDTGVLISPINNMILGI